VFVGIASYELVKIEAGGKVKRLNIWSDPRLLNLGLVLEVEDF
jgi:hypothetical protein